MKLRSVQLVSAAILLALVTACATPLKSSMDFDQQFDFSKVKKIAIAPVDRTELSSIHISDMQVSRVDAAITTELQRKGFEVVADALQADMVLTWHLVTEERTDVRIYNSASFYNCWFCGPTGSDVSVRQYTQGTLIVDMIDPSRNQSVWRSIIGSRLRSEPDSDKSAVYRQEAAQAVFAQFPPTQPVSGS